MFVRSRCTLGQIIFRKGARVATSVPDRLKDYVSVFGAPPSLIQPGADPDQDPLHMPEQQRHSLYNKALGDMDLMRSGSKMDKLNVELRPLRFVPGTDSRWNIPYGYLATLELGVEILREPFDTGPAGAPPVVDLAETEDRRLPYLVQLPNGLIVLPVFSADFYFRDLWCRQGVWESLWFPHPRNGSQWDEFCKLKFPVQAVGRIEKISALATMSIPSSPVGMMLNPIHDATKFITFPEMVHLSKKKKMDEGLKLNPFHPSFCSLFNTSPKGPEFRRLSPTEAEEELQKLKCPVPQLALLELHLLVFRFTSIQRIYLSTYSVPQWKQMALRQASSYAQIDVVTPGLTKSEVDPKIREALTSWSFLSEFEMDVHFNFVPKISEGCVPAAPSSSTSSSNSSSVPPLNFAQKLVPQLQSPPYVLYDSDKDGNMFRGWSYPEVEESIRQRIRFDEPLGPIFTPK